MVCDTPVPLFDAGIKCGSPNDVGDIVRQYTALPHEMVSLDTEFTITVKGDSMVGVNILEGDIVKVIPEVPIHDGDSVVVRVDGEWVVKSYCEDDDGNPWLVPQNDNYEAFPLVGSQDVWLLGKVDRIIRRTPRATFKSCKKKIEQAKTFFKKRQPIKHFTFLSFVPLSAKAPFHARILPKSHRLLERSF